MSILLLLPQAAVAAPPASGVVDAELRMRLIRAMAGTGSFADRFDAQVWLTDMSRRLAPLLVDEERRLELLQHVHREAVRAGLRPQLVLAVIDVESRFDRFAISEAGARGLMQVMPFWLEEIASVSADPVGSGRTRANLFDVATNLRFGCTILRYYLDREDGDMQKALARYNGSVGSPRYPGLVFRALRTRWAH